MNPRLRPTLPLWPDFDPKITHFWGPRVHNWSMTKAKTASKQLICPWKMDTRPIPKVSIFMAVTAKKVTEKAQKQAKMARFWPKRRLNGRVMAWKIFFYQYQWVTKFCAKFGCSRIPRRASIPNSFIVLRCMWKEPAPLCTQKLSLSLLVTITVRTLWESTCGPLFKQVRADTPSWRWLRCHRLPSLNHGDLGLSPRLGTS